MHLSDPPQQRPALHPAPWVSPPPSFPKCWRQRLREPAPRMRCVAALSSPPFIFPLWIATAVSQPRPSLAGAPTMAPPGHPTCRLHATSCCRARGTACVTHPKASKHAGALCAGGGAAKQRLQVVLHPAADQLILAVRVVVRQRIPVQGHILGVGVVPDAAQEEGLRSARARGGAAGRKHTLKHASCAAAILHNRNSRAICAGMATPGSAVPNQLQPTCMSLPGTPARRRIDRTLLKAALRSVASNSPAGASAGPAAAAAPAVAAAAARGWLPGAAW